MGIWPREWKSLISAFAGGQITSSYRCEMRVGKISRTARCKTLKAALEIREAWAKERDELEGNGAKVAPSGGKTPFSIERRAVTVTFD